MRWEKQGLIYAPEGDRWWAKAYATIPTAHLVDDRTLRVYFASLDENRFGRMGFVNLDPNDPHRILRESKEPVLDIGSLGSFDDSGVNPSCVVNVNGRKYLYYIGWQRCERVPYMLFTGLAYSDDQGLTFQKHSRTPILDRTTDEPFSRSAPWVLLEDGVFKSWYWSCTEWSPGHAEPHYNTVIRHATSLDGIAWTSHPEICIQPESQDEYAVGRPSVIHDGSLYRMWYSARSFRDLYKIAYAESQDGKIWTRKDDHAGIEKSASGWDSEMICYPCVVDVRGTRYMFYNGNGHGASGFGLAVLQV